MSTQKDMKSMNANICFILPGWRVHGTRYTALARQLTNKGYIVHIIDFPGFDKEQTLITPMTLEDYVNYVKEYIMKYTTHNVDIFGHSFGGRVGILFSYMYPKYVRTLYLSGTPGYSSTNFIKRFLSMIISKIGHVIFSISILQPYTKRFSELLYRFIGVPDYLKANSVMRETFKQIVGHPLIPFMKTLSVPVVLLWGENDCMVPLWVAEKMKRTIPDARLSVHSTFGHALPFDDPSWIADKIIEHSHKRHV